MAGDTTITVIGNLTADPELRFTPNGVAVTNFTVASTPRYQDRNTSEWKDGEALFLRCNIWREAAENAAESLTRGSRVIVTGRLKQRRWQTPDGQNRTVVELEVDELGPSLRYATAKPNRVKRGTNGDNGFGSSSGRPNSDDRQELVGAAVGTGNRSGGADDPWAVNGAGSFGGGSGNTEPPF
ncbi:single-stranded DNA-binding protein [Nocardia sp. NBC_00881]|uniref:single-stranded DNA-binding protein n=1 Tax=Nocardia sp. NBC_00881 TaxID=2975995 RepID=UPI0038645467|nr:single-stranded DNA-binding protein [Nocardia sp. NBC_00881]